jgi:hypothetical protein
MILVTGEHATITKMSLYTVEDGKVVREEVHYNAPSPSIGGLTGCRADLTVRG